MAVTATSDRPTAMNVGDAERIGSAIAGAALMLPALARPSFGRLLLAAAGAALLQRAVTGNCALHRALGIDTANDRRDAARDDPVESASEDSFPASDPPSWTPVAGTAARHSPGDPLTRH